jgi:hypothetical protein
MQGLAANYLSFFKVDFNENPSLVLDAAAPEDLRELVGLIRDIFGPGNIVSVYEALSVAAESEQPQDAEVDEKVCPLEIYYFVVDFLGMKALSAHGGD